MIALILVVTTAGWFVTERIVEPRLGNWDPIPMTRNRKRKEADLALLITPLERSACGALITVLVTAAVLMALTIPQTLPARCRAA